MFDKKIFEKIKQNINLFKCLTDGEKISYINYLIGNPIILGF